MSSLNCGSASRTLRPKIDLAEEHRLESRVPLAITHGGRIHFPSDAPRNMGSSLRQTAASSGNRIVSIQPDGSEMTRTYAELWDEAKKVSSGLKQLGLQPGDKIIFQFESNHDFISAFWGCVVGGFVPVPIAPAATYEQINSAVSKLHNAWNLLDEPLVLTSDALAKSVRLVSGLFSLETFRVETIESLRKSHPIAELHESKPDDLALLMLTSGSTGIPKAVMLSHRNLLSRSAGTVQMNGFSAADISFSWMPMDHVASLIYFHLRDVYTGCQQINAPAKLILQNPIRWLEWLDHYKATVTFAPNFAFGLINERDHEIAAGNWDLSSLRLLLNGGEAVVARTARKFVQLLTPHGLRADAMHPAWGMSETSSGVTYGDRFSLETTSDDDSFVEVGAPIPGVSLRIVDAENKVVPEGAIGQLQVAGETLMSGYFKKPDTNHEIFSEDGWFKTGDLGLLRDGRLTVTGREKDVIIINGVNYYSHEIEASAEEIPGVERSYTAACSVRDPMTQSEKLAIFFHAPANEYERLTKEIRAKIVRTFGINPEHVLSVRKDQIPKTEIGKIQRSKLKEQFEAGQFDDASSLKEQANRDSFVDGWFNSGDIGSIPKGELHEIEDVVSQIPQVEPAFVATCGIDSPETGTESLGILFVPKADSNAQTTIQSIRNRVSTNFGISPDYIVPVAKEDFPKTTSRRIQRMQFKKMLEAGAFQTYRVDQNVLHRDVEHQSATEKEVCKIWQTVLRAASVSRESNFFELGGDSLRAFQVLSRVREQFGVEIPLHALFEDAATVVAMAHWIDTHEKNSTLPPIESAPRSEPLLLSFPQQRLWLLDQMEGSSTLYTVARCVWLDGVLDKNALRRSLSEIVNRHEILRTTFKLSGETPVQIVHPAREIDPPVVESASSKDEVIKLAIAETQKPFDLKNGPLFRPALFRVGEQHLLLLTFHQIIVDGWSVGLFLEELAQFYDAFRSGENSSLSPLQIQFADFAQWQRRWMTGERITSQLDYWKKQLAGPLPILKLPTDHPRPHKDTFHGAAETLVLPKELFDEVKKFNQHEGTTLFMTLLAVYQLLLRHYANEDDILVGSPVGGRPRLETEKLIGFFANTVVLRTRFEKKSTLRELLAQVRDNAVAAYANADLPFEKLVQTLQPDRHQQNAGLFQVWFGPIDSMPSISIGGSTAEVTNLPITPSQFDLTLLIAEKPDEAVCLFEYKTDLFERTTIQKIARDYEWLLKEFIENPEMEIAAFDEKLRQRTSAQQNKEPMVPLKNPQTDFPKHESILSLIDEQVRRASGKTAVVCGDQSLTYGELDARVNRLANLLKKNGVGPEVAAGLFVERSLEMIIGILAILKAGGAYVPIDPGYPPERIKYVLSEIESPVILTQTKFRKRLSSETKIICIDSDNGINSESVDAPLPDLTSDNLAYVIFTSGSTGKPKGVLVTHKTLLHSTQARMAFYKEPVGNYLLISSFAFDSSVAGIFWTLASGGALILPQEGLHQDPLELVRLMLHNKVSHFLSLPSLYSLILQQSEPAQLASLRFVIVAGESCSQELVKNHYRLLPNTALFNEYGPTEGTVWSTAIQLQPDEAVSIGRPIANARIYILDEQLEPVPAGATGEIFIGGAGIVRGYLKRPELTAERFIADKFSNDPDARLYRTGDLARQHPDGRIEFLGRVDHQVKIRGHRIELEEIECALKQNANVHDAVVLAPEGKLVAYVVAQDGQTFDNAAIREFLQKQLPDFMIPSAFMVLSSFPKTPNGKVDRNALPAVEPVSRMPRTPFVEPRTPIEARLTNIWSGVLGVEKIGVHDDFFELGGHSLLAIQIMARVRDSFQIEIPLPAIFEAKNVAALAETIVQLLAQTDPDGELAQLLSELKTLTDDEARELLEQTRQTASESCR